MSIPMSMCKPPLARSPIHLRSRHVLQPMTNSRLPPPGSLMKTRKPIFGNEEEAEISCDLSKMMNQDFGEEEEMDCDVEDNGYKTPLFERGTLYEEYSRKRNERLKKRKGEKGGEDVEEKKPVYDLGVRTEPVKRRGEGKKYETARKGVVASTSVSQLKEPTSTSRYSLRSSTSKEINKNAKSSSCSLTTGIEEKKTGARRVRRI